MRNKAISDVGCRICSRTWFVITGILLIAAALILVFLAARLPGQLNLTV